MFETADAAVASALQTKTYFDRTWAVIAFDELDLAAGKVGFAPASASASVLPTGCALRFTPLPHALSFALLFPCPVRLHDSHELLHAAVHKTAGPALQSRARSVLPHHLPEPHLLESIPASIIGVYRVFADTSYQRYFFSGFLTLQQMVDNYLLQQTYPGQCLIPARLSILVSSLSSS